MRQRFQVRANGSGIGAQVYDTLRRRVVSFSRFRGNEQKIADRLNFGDHIYWFNFYRVVA